MNDADKADILGRLCTRDEAGRHFYEVWPGAALVELEQSGLIEIYRPIHSPTGIPYSSEYHRVALTDEGISLVDKAPPFRQC